MILELVTKLRAKGVIPRVHGNGFIQLDLTSGSRLHIWGDPRIPRQKVATMIHDHVFGFTSTVIVGRVLNVVYNVVSHSYGDYIVYAPKVRQGEDTILKPTALSVIAEPIHVDMLAVNTDSREYGISPFEYHETVAPDGPAATIIVKDGPTQAQGATAKPRVLVPRSLKPDNEFNRYGTDEDLLWRIIEDTLKLRSR